MVLETLGNQNLMVLETLGILETYGTRNILYMQ